MKELVVVSGKGGTGKTSVAASFAVLADDTVVADCDVDASNLHLVLGADVRRTEIFSGGKVASIDACACTDCGMCREVCRFGAVVHGGNPSGAGARLYTIDTLACEGCGVCAHVCPSDAIRLVDARNGEWFVSESRHGPLVHARLGIGQKNCGKLVTLVRAEGKKIARENGLGLLLIDGAPGIGCPVIASLTGADLALVVTEPTLSALHDVKRVVGVAGKLHVPAVVCLNKWDLNLDTAHRIEEWCHNTGLAVVGLIPYDDAVTAAQVQGTTVVEHSDGAASAAIKDLWVRIGGMLES
jgi:MinD superfamily P-loop ATPase